MSFMNPLSSFVSTQTPALFQQMQSMGLGANHTSTSGGSQQNSSAPSAAMMMGLLQSLMESMMGAFGEPSSQTQNNAPVFDIADYLGNDNYDYPSTTPYDDYSCTCPPPPPVCPVPKEKGSAGLFGDPKFGLFTPTLGDIPNGLKAFDSKIKAGQTVTLLKDSDLGGFKVTAKGIQVDPKKANSIGIGSASFSSGDDRITIQGNGNLFINGQKKGNIHNAGLIKPIKLPSGLTISTRREIDGANGAKAERFVITNGEYKVTAAVRKPHPDSRAYLDMNFEELKVDAADNATGYNTAVPGFTQRFGIPQLLRLEPGDLAIMA